MLLYSKNTLRQTALFLRHNGAVHNTSESPVLLGRMNRACSPGSPGSGVDTHEPWEPPPFFKKFNALLSLSFWKHAAWEMENIFWEGKTHIFGNGYAPGSDSRLRTLKKPDPLFEQWQVLNFENACADLLNFDDVLERSVLVIFMIVILLTSFV